MKSWSVAKQMIREGIRMKIAVVFIILIAAVVLGLPLSISGDDSLTDATQAFLSYALSATGVLLGLLTIFMSRSLSDELVNRQSFMVMTKPIPRWQYILGKWLGISMLNASFLLVCGLTIYGMVHVIVWTHPPLDPTIDEAQLENEVLVARHALPVKMPDFSLAAQFEYERNMEDGLYDDLSDGEKERVLKDLTTKHEMRWRAVQPGDSRLLQFENVLVDRSRQNYIQLRYRNYATRYPPDEVVRALFIFGSRDKGTPERPVPVRHVIDRWHTVRAPVDTIADDNTLTVRYFNYNPFEGEAQYYNIVEFRRTEPVELLFVVGSFEGNLLRLLLLMGCKLLFLAAVAVLMTTVFSFPVASLASLTVFVLSGTRGFITEALDYSTDDFAGLFSSVSEFFFQSFTYVYNLLFWVLPDFGRFNAIEDFVNGRNVSLVWVLQGIGELAILKTVIVLGLAMLLFHRREVAEISV